MHCCYEAFYRAFQVACENETHACVMCAPSLNLKSIATAIALMSEHGIEDVNI